MASVIEIACRARADQAAAARGLPVAEISANFTPPWAGKFASDCFHPSQDGYRDWARALLTAVTLPRSA